MKAPFRRDITPMHTALATNVSTIQPSWPTSLPQSFVTEGGHRTHYVLVEDDRDLPRMYPAEANSTN